MIERPFQEAAAASESVNPKQLGCFTEPYLNCLLLCVAQGAVESTPFAPHYSNFFMTNPIRSANAQMSLCPKFECLFM